MNAGRIPLFIYDDVMWVPYRDLYSLFGFGTNISSLRALMNKLGERTLAGLALVQCLPT